MMKTLDRSPTSTTTPAQASPSDAAPSSRARWGGHILGGFAILFLAFDATMKVLELPQALAGTVELGWPASALFGIGVLQLLLLVIYLVPRTSILGAILWTGYLGGAVATHVRIGNPLFSHQLFPVYVAVMLWGAVWLREPQLRALVPLRA